MRLPCGLGGVGKTQIAVEYTYRHQDEYQFILWASAASEETLRAAYVQMADRLHVPEHTEQEQDKVVEAVRAWLATHDKWLLVVDNADEMMMVRPLLPTGDKGHLLLTTRDQVVAGMEAFAVKPMDHTDGTILLLRRADKLKVGMEQTQIAQAEQQAAEQIVIEMDGLPLALDQAGAYIYETGCSIAEYLDLYHMRRMALLAKRGNINDYPNPVATTWSISFIKVEQANPVAADLLRFCAFLAPEGIPEELITTGEDYLGPLLQSMQSDTLSFNDTMRIVRAYSLLQRDVMEKTLSMHRLVQAVIQNALPVQERTQWMQRAVFAVNASFPDVDDVDQWAACEHWLLHGLVCAGWIEQEHMRFPEATHILNQMAYYLQDRGRYREAEPLFVQALTISEQQVRADHPGTATSLDHLAGLYHTQGKYGEAEPLYQRALAIKELQLGADHPDTAAGLNNLAGLYHTQGKYEEAEPLLVRALAISEQQVGADHPDTAACLHNLADLYKSQGKYREAEPLYQRALAIHEQQLGSDHLSTAINLHNLAGLYHTQGKYEEAEPLLVRALAIKEQQLGADHPDTAICLDRLAGLYHTQGKYEEAEPLYQRALAIKEQQEF